MGSASTAYRRLWLALLSSGFIEEAAYSISGFLQQPHTLSRKSLNRDYSFQSLGQDGDREVCPQALQVLWK
jgi:hypothetical protein